MGTCEQREYTGRLKRWTMNTREVRTGVYGKLKKTELQRRVACCLVHSFLVVLSISLPFLTSKEAWIVTNTN